jgi:ion channel
MQEQTQNRRDLFLLLSLVLVILMYPLLDHGDLQKLILGAMVFVPVILATVRMAQTKRWVWPAVSVMFAVLAFGVASTLFPSRALLAIKWIILATFFGLTVVHLFSYLRNARTITLSHLFTAVSVYVLLGMLFFTLYSAFDVVHPGSFQHSSSAATDRPSDLLYFSLITLSTIGYGDIVPVYGEARMFAALEGMIGVLYVAIMIALLVSAYRRPGD